MPELPEVETVVRGLQERLIGKTVSRVDIFKPLVLKSQAGKFRSVLEGARIASVSRHGKSIFWTLSTGRHIKIHLGMTGALLFLKKDEEPDPYVRLRFQLLDSDIDLVYRDVRQFGRVALSTIDFEKSWGPDAWTSSLDALFTALRQKKGMIKHALMNQTVIAGLGNIYVDETLFGAKIHPKKRLERLKDDRLRTVVAEARRVLGESIQRGGTTFRDYVNSEGRRGGYLRQLSVYGRNGKPCPTCNTTIKKVVVASRGTHFCPKCQKIR